MKHFSVILSEAKNLAYDQYYDYVLIKTRTVEVNRSNP